MDSATLKGLNDKLYEKRKSTAVELELAIANYEPQRVSQIIDQLLAMFVNPAHNFNSRTGGLIGLAGVAIGVAEKVGPYLDRIVLPVVACCKDPDGRIRYHGCESLYNILKVGKGETLIYFNEVFDCLNKLSADSEASNRNGSELVDRLLKDIVSEVAATYVPIWAGANNPNLPSKTDPTSKMANLSIDDTNHDSETLTETEAEREGKKAFSLARFIPLLSERIYVISPYARMHLISWLMVLDSVPDLELVAWLPEILDGILKYLADPNVDVRLAAENVLSEFLREIKYIANVQEKQEAESRRRKRKVADGRENKTIAEEETGTVVESDEEDSDEGEDWEGEGSGAWVPGQGVIVDHPAIMDIIIQHLVFADELVQSTAMEWILTFLEFAQDTVVAFTPRIVPAILPNLASPHRHIKLAAHETNGSLYRVIQSLSLQIQHPTPSPTQTVNPASTSASPNVNSTSATGAATTISTSPPTVPTVRKETGDTLDPLKDPLAADSETTKSITTSASASNVGSLRIKPTGTVPTSEPVTPINFEFPAGVKNKPSRPNSPNVPTQATPRSTLTAGEAVSDDDAFDVRETVNVLTLQFLSDHAETRIAALEWLLMLHLKAPQKILSRDSSTFPALLKTLSDPSEDVVKHDLQLLAQISASSEEAYFTSFMVNVLELFSTDRRLLETRGSLIIRQLCLHLNAERIFRTIAEILEKDDDLEFASMMVIKLNMILITSPELADFRRRLKNLDTKDGQMLFSSLYRSWCHNPVAVFALCLLAQAYEHASNLLQIFADLELTVSLLVQIDKLVMLIESPVFLSLRLQLLEPDKYPFLSKCLYGLLMILPQSSAFVSLRARLMAVHAGGYVPSQPKATPSTFTTAAGATRGRKDEIKWQELLQHFRAVQARHEKSRRRQADGEFGSVSSIHFSSPSQTQMSGTVLGSAHQISTSVGSASRASSTVRRKFGSASGSGSNPIPGRERQSSVDGPTKTGMSPMNPKRSTGLMSPGVSIGGAVASMNPSHGMGVGGARPGSPPSSSIAARRRLMGGLSGGGRKSGV